eukprot:g39163.t1
MPTAVPAHLHFGKSDHNAVLLLLAYKQKLKHNDPGQKVAQCVSLRQQKGLEVVDWSKFKNSVANLNEYAATVTDFINKCVEDCVPKMFPNQKPRMNWKIQSLLKSGSMAYKSGDPDLHRNS